MFNRRIYVSKYYCGKYHFKQFNNEWVLLKKCALLTGGLEVSIFYHYLNSVKKFCRNGFSKFLFLYAILGPTSLWESYSRIPPLISPAGSVYMRAPGKALISWEKSWNWETRLKIKTIWHPWNALHEQIWKHQQFHYNIWKWSFQWSRSSWEIIKCDYTPYT